MAQTWTGATSGNFSVVGNWSSAPAYNGTTDLTFSSTSTNAVANTTNNSFLGANLTIRSLSYDANANTDLRTRFTSSRTGDTARSLTFSATSGSSSISIAAGSTANIQFTVGTGVGNLTASSNLLIDHNGGGLFTINPNINGSGNLTFSGTGNTTVTGVIAIGAANLTKSGSGNLTLNGTNTYTGTTTLNNGRLNINNATAIGSGTLTINGGTIDNTSGSTVTLSTSNAQNWNGDFTFTGTNNLFLGNGTVALGANCTVTVSGGTLGVGGIISGSGYSLTKAGAGMLTLREANTYTGGTTLSAGTLNINNSGSGGTSSAIGTGTLTISGGTIDNTSGSTVTLSTSNAQNWNSDFTFTGSNDLNMGTGAVTMNANRIVTVNGGNLTVGGVISGTTANFTLTKAGAGTMILGGANAYTGATTINAGTLSLGSGGNLSSTTISVASGATLDLTAKSSGYSLGNGATLNGLGTVTTASGQSLSVGTGATIAPGTSSTSGTLTVGGLTLAAGGTYDFTLGNVSGTAGTNWDLISVTNGLTLGSTSANPFTISVSGAATGFSNSSNYNWNILSLGSGSISGFNASNFTISDNIGTTGTFSLSSSGGNITLNYAAGTANAVVYTGNSGGAWATGSNWSPAAAPTSSEVAFFSGSKTNVGINLGTAQPIVGAIFMTNGQTSDMLIGSSAGTSGNLTLNGVTMGGVSNVVLRNNSSKTLTLNATNGGAGIMSVVLGNATDNVIVINGSGGITINTAIAGSGRNLTLQGSGTGVLTLSGANTYTGTTTINAGNLTLGADNRISDSSAVTISGGTLNLSTYNDTVGAFTISSGNLNGSGTLTGSSYALQGGTVNAILGAGAITVSSGTTTLGSAGRLNAASTLAINSGNLTLGGAETVGALSGSGGTLNVGSYTITVNQTSDQTFSGVITGSGGLTKNGAGTLTLNGTNSYNGSTIVNSGTLEAKSAGALGSNNTVQVNGGTLLVSMDDAINGMNITLNGTSTTVASLSFTGNYSGTINNLTLNQDSIIDLGAAYNLALEFAIIEMDIHRLSFHNWSGTTLWGGGNGTVADRIYFGSGNYTLSNVYFYSGTTSDSFLGTGFDLGLKTNSFDPSIGGNQIIPVPEPETWATAVLLVLGGAVWLWRKQSKCKKSANSSD